MRSMSRGSLLTCLPPVRVECAGRRNSHLRFEGSDEDDLGNADRRRRGHREEAKFGTLITWPNIIHVRYLTMVTSSIHRLHWILHASMTCKTTHLIPPRQARQPCQPRWRLVALRSLLGELCSVDIRPPARRSFSNLSIALVSQSSHITLCGL